MQEAMTFGMALDALKAGMRVSRPGWNGWLASQTDMLSEDWMVVE